jgi:hypothetical protein
VPNNPYRNLPLEALYDLLAAAVQEMLDALDKKDPLAVEAKRRLVEILLSNVREKKKEMGE